MRKSFVRAFILFIILTGGKVVYAKTGCSVGKHWVSAHFRRAYSRYDGVFVKASNIKAHCRKNPKGYKYWHQRLTNRRPKVWGYTKEKSKEWSVEALERIVDAISVLPEQLVEQSKVKLYRMSDSQFSNNPATSNYNDIVIYDLALQHKVSLAQILAHELSHGLFHNLSQKDKVDFILSANWRMKKKNRSTYVIPAKNKVFIQEDSKDSIDEDFANHLEYYLFRPKLLKQKSPKSFEWIENKLGKKFKIKGLQ